MLQQLKLFNVGPANSWVLNPLAERLNLITGDNGLGKSFLLDVAWWALSRKWPYDLNAKLTSGYAARPSDVKQPAKICFENPVRSRYESTYIAREQSWQGPAGRPLHSGLVIYARADGSFAIWDSARNYWRKQGKNDVQDTVPAYVFSSQELWYGLDVMRGDKQVRACNGLVTDVISWVHGKGEDAERMASVLSLLSPIGEELKLSGEIGRMSLNDVRDVPKIRTPNGQDVLLPHAGSSIRRVVALAYVLSWAWREHLAASEHLGEDPSPNFVLLFDELEAHLHPRWQRSLLPSLLKIATTLTGNPSAQVQIIATTQSPLVLASIEPHFESSIDALWTLDKVDDHVEITRQSWQKRGDVVMWLVSEVFGETSPYSLEAEFVMNEARQLMSGKGIPPEQIEATRRSLCRVLSEFDPFWLHWRAWIRKIGDIYE